MEPGWSRAPGVVVVQGPVSGSPMTSRLSTEFGPEVYRVPGNVPEPVSFVANQLIKQGGWRRAGKTGVKQMADSDSRSFFRPKQPRRESERPCLRVPPVEKRLFELIRIEEPIRLDDLAEGDEARRRGVL